MADSNEKNGSLDGTWSDWSKYVLKELTRLDCNEKEMYGFVNTLQGQIQKTITVLEGVVTQQGKLEKRLDILDENLDTFKLSMTQKLSIGGISAIFGGIIVKLIEFVISLKNSSNIP